MDKNLRILMLEDVPSDAELVEYELRKAQLAFISKRVETREDFLKALKDFNPDLVFVDYMLPQFDGITALNLVRERAPSLPVIIVTGSVNEETAVECMKAGAWDYVLKDHLRRMSPAVLSVLEKKQKMEEKEQADEEIKLAHTELDQIFNTVADGMRVVDRNFNMLRVNKAFSSLSGTREDEAVGKKCYEIFPGSFCHTDNCPLTRIISGEELVEYDEERERNDGTKISCIITATPFRNHSGELIGIVENLKDITERKKAEEEVRKSRENLRELARHLELIREKERTRIAREIHDDLGQTLTALKIGLSRLSLKLPQDQTVLVEQVGSMSGLVDKTIQTVQKISTELRPSLLDNLGLTAATEWQVREFQEHTGIKCDLILDCDGIMLDNGRSTSLFRILQETLTNIIRHANATRVKISLKKENSKVVLEVKDNGVGITKEQISDHKSFGLVGMRERVHFWEGEVKVNGIRGSGTTVTVTMPLYKKEKRRGKRL